MNIYTHNFAANCPSDGDLIVYRLEIRSETMIRVEHIKAAAAQFKSGYQEEIADSLHRLLGGIHHMTGVHQGVSIETERP